ncbi:MULTISPECIES: TatD family hydrolase [Paenibacillus]|uniref:TatD family hydrolase n=1 Tax=Paenibacillus cucumis (ex Kampfer et al. 2016) TaxID=1776858 RepID=A0ABS7KQJ4_9BACL|nr:TatD family hydrolase [Paenibacillus cucumis (ex Kampfer et al. 2016)]MBY0206447.1 TatD family hydrolase [Paenibacillus cucumis (ex Kampfer et al. 2016)]MDP9700902.1 TatD DNase family protein [Paenibacillus intestini]
MHSPTFAPLIDAHIHFDKYTPEEQEKMLLSLPSHQVEAVIAVSMNLASAQANLELAKQHPRYIYPAFGYHPEQQLPSLNEQEKFFLWIEENIGHAIAIGEVGLPYYNREEAQRAGLSFDQNGYIDLLEQFIILAKKHHKPIILHAVYEDADIACELLEKHQFTRAHFHWFKGSKQTIRRMANNGYYISFTPDILYDTEIRELARQYPAEQVMAETDGPWPFEGPFQDKMTHPAMTRQVIQAWSEVTGMGIERATRLFYRNTKRFYRLPE